MASSAQRRVRRAGLAAWPARRPARAGPGAAGSGVSSAARSQERGGGRQAAAGLRPAGRALQLGGDVLVGPDGGVRAVPGAAIGIDVGIGRLGQRAVHAAGARAATPPGRPPSVPADGGTAPARRTRSARPRPPAPRPSAPMPEPSAARHSSVGSPTGSAAAISSSRRVSAGAARAAAGSPPRSGLASGRDAGQSEPARQLRRRQAARQLQQRQRVAARLGHDPVAHPLVQRPADRPSPAAPAHRRRAARHQRAPAAPPAPARRRARRTAKTNATDSASSRRATNASACAEARSSHCASSTRQTSGCSSATSDSRLSTARPTRKRSGACPCAQAERGAQRVALRRREALEPVEHRRAQLMQPGERELHLRLDARRSRDRGTQTRARQVVQQRGLADPGLAAQDQHPALTGPHASPATGPAPRARRADHTACAGRCTSKRVRTRAVDGVHPCSLPRSDRSAVPVRRYVRRKR